MYTIKKAFIEIDINEYLENLSKYQGYIDADADFMREPNDTYKVDSFDSLKQAEREIDTDVVLTIELDQVTIEYYYIEGSDKVYFTHVLYENKRYPVDKDLYSKSCCLAIWNNTDFNDKAVVALKKYERKFDVKFDDDDPIYVRSYINSKGHRVVEVSERDADGILCDVRDLKNIDDWWEQDWNY